VGTDVGRVPVSTRSRAMMQDGHEHVFVLAHVSVQELKPHQTKHKNRSRQRKGYTSAQLPVRQL
jgi:hypothetical protein